MSAAVRPIGTNQNQGQSNQSMPLFGTGNGGNDDSSSMAMGEESDVGGFDVNKLDSSALQDVIQYSGVDLKAEAEMILKGHESFLPSTFPAGKDPRLHHDYYFNVARLKALVSAAVLPKRITDMSEDCLDMIALATQRRLANVISQLSEISRNRVDQGRSRFKIKIENDSKRQMWLVEQFLNAENERVNAGQGASGSSDNLSLARAKLKKTEKRTSEDVAVKTKLANVTAAVATGLQLKSWMTDPSALATPLPDSSTSQLGSTPESGGTSAKMPLHFSQAPSMTPISDRELQGQFAARTISFKDLIFFAENDPRLRHSIFLLSLYNQLGNT